MKNNIKIPTMQIALPFDIHYEIISKNIKTHADFMRYLVLVNNADIAKRLIAEFSKTFILQVFTTENIDVGEVIPNETRVTLIADRVRGVIPFHANVVNIMLLDQNFNPAFFANYTNIEELSFYGYGKFDGKTLAETFPNVRKITFNIQPHMENTIGYFNKLNRARVFGFAARESDIFARNKNIQFELNTYGPSDIREPNVKFIITTNLSNIEKFAAIVDRVVELRVEISLDDNINTIVIPQQFRNISRLSIVCYNRAEIFICGFNQLESLVLKIRKDCEVTITDTPYLTHIQKRIV